MLLDTKNRQTQTLQNLTRGAKKEPPNKTPTQIIYSIKNHINRFPRFRSDYSQKDSGRYFFDPILNIAKMYKLYKEECEENHQPFAKDRVYRSIFNTAFNISFKAPQTRAKHAIH